MIKARSRLPDRRPLELFDFAYGGRVYTAGIGFYFDGRIGEVFLDIGKSGSEEAAAIHGAAIALSDMLQRDTPLGEIRSAAARLFAAPEPIVALLDYLFGDATAAPSRDFFGAPS